MIYRFYIVSDEVDNFKRVIDIDADDNFLSLRNAILDAVDYSHDQMDSFFICNDDWSKEKEITLADMGSDSDEDIWIMEQTTISDMIEDEGQRLIFVFDYLNDRCLFIEMKKSICGENIPQPRCSVSEGSPAPQFIDQDPIEIKKPAQNAKTADYDTDFYGDEAYNEDELDPEGYDDLTFDNNL